MRCDRCGRENPDHLSFCEDCGFALTKPKTAGAGTVVMRSSPHGAPVGTQRPQAPPLQLGERPASSPPARAEGWVMCSACQTRNEPGHRFCIACGSPLAQPDAPAQAAPAAPPPVAQPPAAPPPATSPPAAAPAPPAPTPAPAAAPRVSTPKPQVIPSGTAPTAPQPVAKAPVPQPASESPPLKPAGSPRPLPRPAGFQPSGSPHARPATVPDGLAAVAVAAAAHEPASPLQAAPVVPLAPSSPPPQPASIICPRCQSSSNASFPFCSVCGFPLQSKATTSAPAPVPAPAPAANPFPPPVPSNPPPATPAVAPQPVLAPGTDELMRTGQYAPTPATKPSGKLVLLGKDGSDGMAYPLLGELIDVGSREGPVQIPDDPYMSPRHARLQRGETGAWQIIDLDSVNGVYVRLRGPRQISDGDLILLGQQVLRFEVVMDAEQGLRPATQHGTALFGTPQAPRFARLCQRTVEGVTRDVYHLHRAETSLGRETADIVFSDDPFLSRRHAVIRIQQPAQPGGPRAFVLEDHGSSNGTFVAIRGREPLQSGDVVRMGLHVFRIDLQESDRGARQ